MVGSKYCSESLVVKTSIVFPTDTNTYGTLFGGKLMAYIDDTAAIAAMKHARKHIVTASTDSVDFLHPIQEGNSVCLEAFVTYTGTSSMEVFVKVTSEDLLSGEKHLCALSFLTMVAIDEHGKPTAVPQVVPQTEEEISLFESGKVRAQMRRNRKAETQELARKYKSK
ncbi:MULTISPECIES: acyl-CoA thioesterase [Niallia]|uniref:Acyl-CoA thioesterase n=1 Tax=Niallia circulans TaxID=1397 RepID=A0A553SGE7_NIACI|nr:MULTISPECIES: acyl-CoA thioesterase [Niallia]MCT2343730.1 acyl-CoA thioesterase [Niallia taxi]MDE5055566.1 acyl-CoA thioesterase [Niallia taxi]MED3965359.1 acyl-CoA thioesterase [Niallia taxi]TRZ36062.1 acyl-CoA thioesterase [Niallia circulans]WOD62816.1 acyl-CoA thioesterase [Niallia taxi]